jgi:hypothetical protein
MNPDLIHQMAQARQADLLREAEEYRRAGLTARPTVLRRVTARIPRITARTGRRRKRSLRRRHPAVRENGRSGEPLMRLGEDRLGRRQTRVRQRPGRDPA